MTQEVFFNKLWIYVFDVIYTIKKGIFVFWPIKKEAFSINLTVCFGPLGADCIVGILSISWILRQTRSIHQVEKIAVVGAEIQNRFRGRSRKSLKYYI